MRVLILNHNIRGEATWHRAWNIALQMQRNGHEATIYTVRKTRALRPLRRVEQGVNIIETPYLFSKRAAASGLDPWDIAFRLLSIIKKQWDVLYAFGSLPNVGFPFLLAKCLKPHKKFLSDWDDLFCNGGIYEYLNKGVTRPLYNMEQWLEHRTRIVADGVTTTSLYLLELATALRSGCNVAYLPTGANPAAIPALNAHTARRALNLPPDKIILVYIGGGFNEDVLLMLDAFAVALREIPNLYLLQVGEPDPRYTAKTAQHKMQDSILLKGRMPFEKIPVHLAAADILLMPLCDCLNSRARGPIKLRDYICAGRPIIGTDLGEVGYWLKRHQIGRLATPGHEAFAKEIVALARDPEAMLRFGKEARRVAEQELSWDVVGRLLNELLKAWIT